MKTRNFIIGAVIGLLLATPSLRGAEPTKLSARSGGKMRVEGTSPLHDWQLESKIIGGSMEVGDNFPLEPGQEVKPGKVEAKAEAFIPVRSLQSVEKNGTHYSDKMDEVTWGKLKAKEFPKIVYHVTELVLKESAKSKDAPYLFDSKGELAVAGVTNTVSMPIKVLPLGEKKLKISGTIPVKMTDYKIEPQTIVGISIGDEMKLIFDWMVAPAKATPTTADSK